MQYKALHWQIKAINDGEGIIEGYLSTFNTVDEQNDRVIKGAFKQTIKEAKARRGAYLWPMLYQHDPDTPIGGVTSAVEDSYGLFTVAQFDLDIQRGRETYSAYKKGYMNQLSIGYDVVKKFYDEKGVRNLQELRLHEQSCVTFAANPDAVVTGVKANMRKTFADYLAGTKAARYAQKAGRNVPSATWGRIHTHLQDLYDLIDDGADITDIRKKVGDLEKQLHAVPATAAQDLGKVTQGSTSNYAGYDNLGNPKSRFARLEKMLEEAYEKASPEDRSIFACQVQRMRRSSWGIAEKKDLTGAELQAKYYARSGAVFNPKLGRFVEV